MLNPVKLLDKVLPKELVGLILQHEFDEIKGNIPAFSYKELRSKIDKLESQLQNYCLKIAIFSILAEFLAERAVLRYSSVCRVSCFS